MLTRVMKTAAATLSHTFYAAQGSASEAATDSSTTVTVAVTDANGTSVTSGNATHPGTTGLYQFALPAQSALKLLTVTWTATISGVVVVETDTVEIVGGFLFSLTEGRASDSSLSDTSKYPVADLAAALLEVEEECEWICDRAFVPRYRRAVLDGTGTSDVLLTDQAWADDGRSMADVRTIRSATVAPRFGQTAVALTSTQLAALYVTADGQLRRTDGDVWTEGNGNVVVEVEYGWDVPPVQLVKAAKTRFRSRLNLNKSGIPDRASSFTATDGGTYRILLPDAYRTGIPEVDAVYSRYSRRVRADAGTQGGAGYPSSRTLSYDPQRNALFHGGAR